MPDGSLELDVIVFGGGSTGLWLLDALRRRGDRCLLLEAGDLGSGQTIASQGIIHGGLKYSLRGMLTPSAQAIRSMPDRWHRSLAGETAPDLSHTRLRSDYCHLWQTTGLRSRMGMLGALKGLAVTAQPLERHERPAALAQCPGTVARLDEQVIEPASFLGDLARQHADAILSIDARGGLEFERTDDGRHRIRLLSPETGEPLDLVAARLVLCAGGGNAELRRTLDLPETVMQRRPLHMVVARGDLPVLNGHCVDGMHTRATITTTHDHRGRVVWQVGGQLAEDGVDRSKAELVDHARGELAAILPGIDLDRADWGSYRVDRAEATTDTGERPGDTALLHDDDVLTAWPTKLALVPRLVDRILELVPRGSVTGDPLRPALSHWPRPAVAAAPWDEEATWNSVRSAEPAST